MTDIDEMLEDIKNQVENLTIQDVILILVGALVLLYFILTKTQRGREVRKKFIQYLVWNYVVVNIRQLIVT